MERDKEDNGEEKLIVLACDSCKKFNTEVTIGVLIEEYETIFVNMSHNKRGKLKSVTLSTDVNKYEKETPEKKYSHVCVECYQNKSKLIGESKDETSS